MDIKSPTLGTRDSLYTRMRVGVKNPRQLQFKIRNKGMASNIMDNLKSNHIITGDNQFDYNYIVDSDDQDSIMKLLLNDEIKELIKYHKKIIIFAINVESVHLYGHYIEADHSLLQFRVPRIIKNVDKIVNLFNLCTKIIDEIEEL